MPRTGRVAHSTLKTALYLRFRTAEKKNPVKRRSLCQRRGIGRWGFRNVGL
ncbi:hypothetical protein Pan44_11620 [Caulifigura coniformis]|uniref:Uncharacterized protein n=1 Tax=Caulifigura coniformis TaxID=2527983 RepID=A0A517SAI9_9PLAN|nr:hypothetical protein Pan44_11620 [Caulifigura coniformis]